MIRFLKSGLRGAATTQGAHVRIAIISLASLSATASLSAFGSALAQDIETGTWPGEVTDAASQVDLPLNLEAGQLVTISTESDEGFDTILTLLGPDGRQIADNDDCNGTLQSCLIFAPQATATYTARVTGYGGSTGSFELVLEDGVDMGLSYLAETLHESIVTLDSGHRELSIAVELDAGAIFVASTYALENGAGNEEDSLDTTLALRGPGGAVVAENDDRGDGSLNSQLVFQPETAGLYTVVVSSYDGYGEGDLVLSLALDPNARPPFDFSSIDGDLIAEHVGTLDASTRELTFPVELAAGQTLMALADATMGDLDTVLTLSGPDGYPVAMNDDRGDGSLNSAIAFTAPAAGTYALELSRYRGSDTSGEFRLVLSSVAEETVDVIQTLHENMLTLSGPEELLETEDFLIHYTLSGSDASSAEYARLAGIALQDSYDAQIIRDGWAEPVRDDNGRYRVYVADADGAMGYTKPVQIVFDNPNTGDVRESLAARTAFVLDNDFRGIGKAAPPESLLRATATHEFNHVVQFGYDAEEGLDWLYEATASWIETATMGSDQDATDYVSTDFETPHLCWTTMQGGHDYAQWTLLDSMAQSHGNDIVRRLWENSVTMDGFQTMSETLAEVGSDIPGTIEMWRARNYALAYDLAPLFDATVNVRHRMSSEGRWTSKGGLEQLGADYIVLDMSGRYGITLRGDEGLELVGLGRNGDEVVAIHLGRDGVFDTRGFSDAALMVFHSTVPDEPGTCTATGYTIDVTTASGRMAAPAYRFDAPHFVAPGQEDAEDDVDQVEEAHDTSQ